MFFRMRTKVRKETKKDKKEASLEDLSKDASFLSFLCVFTRPKKHISIMHSSNHPIKKSSLAYSNAQCCHKVFHIEDDFYKIDVKRRYQI